MSKNNKQLLIIPKIRFKKFNDLFESCKFKNNIKIFDGPHLTPTYFDEGYPFYSVETITSKKFKYIDEEQYTNFKKIYEPKLNDILFTRIGVIGKTMLVEKIGFSIYVSISALRLINDNIAPLYLLHYISSIFFINDIRRNSLLTAVPMKINIIDMYKLNIKYPSLEEQTKIANFFTLLDKQIQLMERKLELYELRKKYYLNNMFCDDDSNLPKLRFEGFEEKFYNNNLSQICQITKGDQINNENLTNNGKYYYLNGGSKLSGWTDNFNRLGNIISISEGGESCGFVNYNLNNFWSGGHLYTLDNLEDKINTYFLFSVLKHKQKSIMRLRVGTGLPNIQKPSLSKINIIYPKLEEQTKIANLFSSLDESIKNIKKQKDQLTKRKTYYLNNMFV